jgi:RNA polymerase sigma factor (sigma-70 family)
MLADRADRELVERLITAHDQAAFEAIVQRHGAMVYRVCWRVLRQEQDVEDAFQATFLLLAQNMASIRKRASLASWLHGVAHRVALKARTQAALRRHHEYRLATSRPAPVDDLNWGELRAALDAKLARLPDKWRLPLILCYLEGRTQDEAAAHLGWGKNTLRRRLDEARTALARRFRWSGAWPAALSAVLLSDAVASAAPAQRVISSTVEAALRTVAGRTATEDVVSEYVASLMEGVQTTMLFSRTRIVMSLMVMVGVLVAGVGAVVSAGRIGPAAAANSSEAVLPQDEPQALDDKGITPNKRNARKADRKSVLLEDVVTVLYRGKTHTLTGKQAEAVRNAGLGLLESSCEERVVSIDAEATQRYATIRKRSYVLITFVRQLSVRKAGNNRVPVPVKSLLIPFSPDLDPEVVYVLPGKSLRMFAEMTPDGFDTIRSALVDAGIYPPEVAPLKVAKVKAKDEEVKENDDPDSVFPRADELYQNRDYHGVCQLLQKPLERLRRDSTFKDKEEVTRARFQLADSYFQIAVHDNQAFLMSENMSAGARKRYQREQWKRLQLAAEEFASLNVYLTTDAGKEQLTPQQRTMVPFITAKCWFNLGEYEKALKVYERLINSYPSQREGLDALGGAVQCHAALGQLDDVKHRLDQIRNLLTKLPEEVRKAWQPWLTECFKQLK